MSTSNSFNAAMNNKRQPQSASSLDYLYEAISVVETKNNFVNQPPQQHHHVMQPQFYNSNEQQPQQQYSLVDPRRYFSKIFYLNKFCRQANYIIDELF